jgi:hypothetical protein
MVNERAMNVPSIVPLEISFRCRDLNEINQCIDKGLHDPPFSYD